MSSGWYHREEDIGIAASVSQIAHFKALLFIRCCTSATMEDWVKCILPHLPFIQLMPQQSLADGKTSPLPTV